MKKTIRECLETIGVTLGKNMTLDEEFKAVKKAYFQKVLVCHPDKGGDPAIFREVQTSFEVLREMMKKNVVSSFAMEGNAAANDYDETMQDFGNRATPSWQYYYEAAEEEVPIYRMELAKSGRGKCYAKTKTARTCSPIGEVCFIEKGHVRVGRLEEESGSYTNWVHLECWRVPSRVWMGFPQDDGEENITDEAIAEALAKMELVLLCGFDELPRKDQAQVIQHVKDKSHWAKMTKRRQPKKDSDETSSNETGSQKPVPTVQTSSAVVPVTAVSQRQNFVVPIPGRDGAIAGSLAGKTVVLTGIFPEVGGGAGLNLGKDKVKRMVESFGGRVTSSVSGKTDILIVGKEPGMSKVSQARDPKNNKKSTIQVLDLHEISNVCRGLSLEEAEPATIGAFSAGFRNNGKALLASEAELERVRSPPKSQKRAATKKEPPTKVAIEAKDSSKTKSKAVPKSRNKNKRKTPPKPSKSPSIPETTVSMHDSDAEEKTLKRKKVQQEQTLSKKPRRCGAPESCVSATVNEENVAPSNLGALITEADLTGMKVAELKVILRKNGLSASGRKAELIDRLGMHFGSMET